MPNQIQALNEDGTITVVTDDDVMCIEVTEAINREPRGTNALIRLLFERSAAAAPC